MQFHKESDNVYQRASGVFTDLAALPNPSYEGVRRNIVADGFDMKGWALPRLPDFLSYLCLDPDEFLSFFDLENPEDMRVINPDAASYMRSRLFASYETEYELTEADKKLSDVFLGAFYSSVVRLNDRTANQLYMQLDPQNAYFMREPGIIKPLDAGLEIQEFPILMAFKDFLPSSAYVFSRMDLAAPAFFCAFAHELAHGDKRNLTGISAKKETFSDRTGMVVTDALFPEQGADLRRLMLATRATSAFDNLHANSLFLDNEGLVTDPELRAKVIGAEHQFLEMASLFQGRNVHLLDADKSADSSQVIIFEDIGDEIIMARVGMKVAHNPNLSMLLRRAELYTWGKNWLLNGQPQDPPSPEGL